MKARCGMAGDTRRSMNWSGDPESKVKDYCQAGEATAESQDWFRREEASVIEVLQWSFLPEFHRLKAPT